MYRRILCFPLVACASSIKSRRCRWNEWPCAETLVTALPRHTGLGPLSGKSLLFFWRAECAGPETLVTAHPRNRFGSPFPRTDTHSDRKSPDFSRNSQVCTGVHWSNSMKITASLQKPLFCFARRSRPRSPHGAAQATVTRGPGTGVCDSARWGVRSRAR